MLSQPRATSLITAWQPVGPLQIASLHDGSVTGRITSIAIDPADPTGNTVYIGTTGGGIWKSTNAAGPADSVSFVALTDNLSVFDQDAGNSATPSLSIGALSVANGVILAGTGDPNDALDSYYGSGVLRSADGGATWTLAKQSHDGASGHHSFLGLGFAEFASSSASPSTVVAAVSDAAEGVLVNAVDAANSVRGLYYSTDSGVTWQMASIKDGNQTVQMPLLSGSNHGGNAATAVAWNSVRQRFYAAVRYHGYYESVDGSAWTRLAAQPGTGLTSAACPANPEFTGSTACPIFRGALAVDPASGDTFAFTVDAQDRDQGIWRDICASNGATCASSVVAFSSQLDTTPMEVGNDSTAIFQGGYNLSLAAVPSGADTLLFAGTVDLFRCSVASGCVFRNTTNIDNGCSAPALVAPAQHAIAALTTGAAPLVLIGNDGGLWRSTDGVNQQESPCSADDATHFQNLNSGIGSLAEVINFAQHPTDPDTFLIGVGANGSAVTSTASAGGPWPQAADGEGGFTAIDQQAPANRYISTAAGVSITYCGNGPSCGPSDFAGLPTIGAAQTASDAALIDPPWLLDPALSANVLIGTCRVWRGPAASGSDWSTANVLSTNFGGPQNASCTSDNPVIRSLAAGGPVSASTAAENAGSKSIYAGLAGTLDGGGQLGGHLFLTTAGDTADKATEWSDLASSPVSNDPVNAGAFNPGGFDISSMAVDPHDSTGGTVYATVMGFSGNNVATPHLYRSVDTGSHWANISSNLPNAPANSVVVDPNDANTVYVALDTGVYVTTQVATCASSNCWSIYGVDLPYAPIVQLTSAPAMSTGTGHAVGELRAATYGRGIWQIPLLTATVAVSAAISLSQTSLSFASQAVGTSSAAQSITATNSGTAPLNITSLEATGDFHETDNCTGSPIKIAASCTMQVSFLPTSTGTRTGIITIFGNVPGGSVDVALTGVAAAPASIVLDPLAINFGTVISGATSAAQNLTISNTGGVFATMQTPSITGDFQIATNTCGTSLSPGVSCIVAVVFKPAASGTRNGSLTVTDSTGTQLASLTGVGASPPTDSLSPLVLSFGSQQSATTSAPQNLTLLNSGDSALTLVSAQITSGSFTVVSGCGSSLAGHSGCVLQVAFAPTVSGTATGTLTVSDQLRTQTVALSGTGIAPPQLALSPSTISFPGTLIGQSSSPTIITVTNSGGGHLAIGNIAVTGSDFAETDNCAAQSLSGTASCSIRLVFSPAVSGDRSGTLTVTATGAGSTTSQQATVSLTGTGITPAAVTLTPASLVFGTITLGSSSPAQDITVSNTGGQTATLQTITIKGDFTVTVDTCGLSLAPSAGCTIGIVFTPSTSGARSGMVSITDSAGTQTAALTGSGASLATDLISPLSLNFGQQAAGSASAAQNVTLSNTGDDALTLIAAQISNSTFTVANGCGSSLSGHSACSLQIAFIPTVSGPVSGTLTVSDALRTQTISLTGSGVSPPQLALAPSAVIFPTTLIGQTSAAQTVTVSNSGAGTLVPGAISVTGDFTETDNCAARSLTGSASCIVQLVFSPTASGNRSGTLTISASSPGSTAVQQASVSLTGIAIISAAIVLTPASADFGTITLGSSSAAQNVTVSNTGGQAATIQTASITGDFAIAANSCGASLAPSTGCTIAVVFKPSAAGARTGTLSVVDSVGTQTATFTGVGAAVATDALSPLSLSFLPQQLNTASASQQVTLTNLGDNALTLIAAQVTTGDFTAVSGCGASLNGHSSCTIAVASTPKTLGASSGILTVTDQFRSQTVALSATGVAPPGVSLSPSGGLTFAATGVSLASVPQTVTVSNQGSEPLSITSLTATGDFSVPTATNTCNGSIAPAGNCAFQIVFSPTAGGPRSGSVSIADNAPTSPQSVTLTGTGVDFGLAINGASSATVGSGESATFPLLLSSDAGVPGTAAMTCTGAPLNATCVVTPASPALGQTSTISVTVETGVTASAQFHLASSWTQQIRWVMALPFALPFMLLGSSRRRKRSADGMRPSGRAGLLLSFYIALLAGLVFAIGCGSGRTIPPEKGPPGPTPVTTPSGTYPITVTAASAGLTKSVTLTLVVQ